MTLKLRSKSLAVLALLLAAPVLADDKQLGPANATELSYIATSGNSEASSLALRNTFTYTWEPALLKLEAGAFQAETTTITRTVVPRPADGFEVRETKTTRDTAENYFLRGRYDRNFATKLFWFVGAGWERNEFAGLSNRYSGVAGVGYIVADTDAFKLRADVGLTYTKEDLLVEVVGRKDDFAGFRASYDLKKVLTPSTTWTSLLIADANLDETDDVRADFTNALSVAISDHLALKASLQLLYDNQPALVAVPTGVPVPAFVAVELDDLDSITSVALVVNF
jgi:putative salt-induced outer membrane protein YdiY